MAEKTDCNMRLPEAFIQYTRQMMGEALWGTFEQALREEPPVSIRWNPLKNGTGRTGDMTTGVPWCRNGFYLSHRPNFTFDPKLHAGAYYVQEASSMFLDRVLRQYVKEPVMMLDLCAAPGGKSTAARAALPDGSLLLCNEPIRLRAQILTENMQKFGHPDVIVTSNYPKDYGKSGLLFDVIMADVPCSGEGMFRKDDGAIGEWSVQQVDKCQKLQREIVAEAWKCLKTGGLLIYSTCTFNLKENEENVAWIAEELGAEVLPVETDADWHITGSLHPTFRQPVYRFIPGRTKGEGLFMAVLRKTADTVETGHRKPKTKLAAAVGIPKWIENAECFAGILDGQTLHVIPQRWIEVYAAAKERLHVIHAGIPIGQQKGKDLIPAQSLALSVCLRREAFPCVELSYEEAIQYLRKEAIALPEAAPTGFVLVAYSGLPIGFVKNIGHRANNLYPAEWRIKSTHIPTNPDISL